MKKILKKTFLTLAILVLSLISITVFAEISSWTQQTIPSHGFLNYMASSADGSTLVLGVNGGGSLIWVGTGCGSIGQCGAWTSQTATSTIGVTMSSVAIDAAGDKMVAVAVSGDVYVGTACSGGLCTWTDQGSGPGSHGWQEVSMSSDGSIISVDGSSTDVWIGTSCGSGTCTWHDAGVTPGNQSWRTMAMSSDGSKIATSPSSGDIWIGTGCTSGTCSTWTDQGTSLGEPGVQSWRSLSFSSDGSKLAGAVVGGDLWIGTSCTTGTCSTWTNQATDTSGSWYSVAFSADGTKLAASENGGDVWLGESCGAGLCTWHDQGTVTFGGTKAWRSIASSADGTKIAVLINANGTNGIWTAVINFAPTITTDSASAVTQSSATLTGTITSTGGSNATAVGFNYGTSQTYGSVASTSGSFGVGDFSQTLTNLSCGTTYYYQAFATNSAGTNTGTPAQIYNTSFLTSPCSVSAVSHGGGGGAIIVAPLAMPTSSNNQQPLSFNIINQQGTTITLSTNANPSTVKGYAIGFKPDLSDSLGINPYTGGNITYTLPDTNTHTIYLRYYSTTGVPSSIISQTISSSVIQTTVPSPTTTQTNSNTTSTTFTRTLAQGMTGTDVKALQVFLNTHGFIVASTGAGSPSNETNYFGIATKNALIKFQNANKIKPASGMFGAVTRGVVEGK